VDVAGLEPAPPCLRANGLTSNLRSDDLLKVSETAEALGRKTRSEAFLDII